MANFFSADYWKALYFKAMGGQETAVDPNAMSGSFAGSSSWTGTITNGAAVEEVQSRSHGGFDPYYYKKRKKKQPQPVSREFGDDWKPPVPRATLPAAKQPLPAGELIARQEAALEQNWKNFSQALLTIERERAEALARAEQEQKDEEEIIMLLLAA